MCLNFLNQLNVCSATTILKSLANGCFFGVKIFLTSRIYVTTRVTIVNDDILFGDDNSFWGRERAIWVRYEGMVKATIVVSYYGSSTILFPVVKATIVVSHYDPPLFCSPFSKRVIFEGSMWYSKLIILQRSSPSTILFNVLQGCYLCGIYTEKEINTPLLRSPLTFVVPVFQGSDLCDIYLEKQIHSLSLRSPCTSKVPVFYVWFQTRFRNFLVVIKANFGTPFSNGVICSV